MRRTRLLTSLIAAVSLAAAAVFIVGAPVADADTVDPGIDFEGWFARSRPADPQVDTCGPGGILTPVPNPCGPTSPADVPTTQSKGTGHYVVSSSGGPAGDKSQNSGDTGWAAFQWDLLDQFGATADKFVVTLFQAEPTTANPDQQVRLDTYNGTGTPPPIQACNVLEAWAAEPGPNPWETRPTDSQSCVVPTVKGREFTFDVTSFASTWLDGTGFGMVIRPGAPGADNIATAFQITFSGYYDQAANAKKPKVAFEFTPVVDDSGFFGGGGFDDGGFEDISTPGGGSFEAVPDLDVIPTDAGSDPLPEQAAAAPAPTGEAASPLVAAPTRPISNDPKFPWIVLLLIPFILLAFWSTGTALGPVGDPVPARAGGVSRVLAQRNAGGAPTDPDTRY